MSFKAAPLPASFMLLSLFGLLLCVLYLWKVSLQWAFAFGLLFLIMVIASFVSMTYADPDPQLGIKRKIK